MSRVQRATLDTRRDARYFARQSRRRTIFFATVKAAHVIREVQYQFEVNRLKGNFGWAWPMWAVFPRIDRIVIREVQYQFEVNQCRNEEIIVKGNFGWAWTMWPGCPRIDLIVIREAQYQFEVNRCRNEEVNFQGSSANSVGGAGGQDGRTDARTHINTISPLFLRKTWG
ncbi:hypothetical protein DPMN_125930 [Dreissena polymorpha]|uniref:Uncharacterized protein n=1 Tax=Dreissena polymorpha TaxID=45954 RepID=A0A9D4H2C7_DREPO|nr:hypothetical protein DPMN_125930 [Dreissena polymorpha]